jgi:hypothetical protein
MGDNFVNVELLPLAFSRYLQNASRLAKKGLIPDSSEEKTSTEIRSGKFAKIKEFKFSAKRFDNRETREVYVPHEKPVKRREQEKSRWEKQKAEKARKKTEL